MSENIEEKIRSLKEIEAKHTAEMAQRRQREEDNAKRAYENKVAAEFFHRLQNEKSNLAKELEMKKKESFLLEIEAQSLKKTFGMKSQELKKAEEVLNTVQEQIWKGREVFCDEIGILVDRYGVLSDCWKQQVDFVGDKKWPEQFNVLDEENNKIVKENAKEIEDLNEKIKILHARINKMEKTGSDYEKELVKQELEKERLLKEPFSSSFLRIERSIEISKNRCKRLRSELTSHNNQSSFKRSTSLQTKDQYCNVKSDEEFSSSNLFSVVDVQKLKKFSENRHAFSLAESKQKAASSTFTNRAESFPNAPENSGSFTFRQRESRQTLLFKRLKRSQMD